MVYASIIAIACLTLLLISILQVILQLICIIFEMNYPIEITKSSSLLLIGFCMVLLKIYLEKKHKIKMLDLGYDNRFQVSIYETKSVWMISAGIVLFSMILAIVRKQIQG